MSWVHGISGYDIARQCKGGPAQENVNQHSSCVEHRSWLPYLIPGRPGAATVSLLLSPVSSGWSPSIVRNDMGFTLNGLSGSPPSTSSALPPSLLFAPSCPPGFTDFLRGVQGWLFSSLLDCSRRFLALNLFAGVKANAWTCKMKCY